jgi:oxygen-independent coproporphyrinogen-3 oxidase
VSGAEASQVARPPAALYIHVPFCLSICPYCDFVVVAGSAARGPRSRISPFVDAVEREIELRGQAAAVSFGQRRAPLGSVYFGGGTPSLLAAADVARLLGAIERRFGIAAGAEITLEANPGPDERGDLAGFRLAGINRLSIGAQSLQPDELRRLGRRHSPADVADTVRLARLAGFDSLSLDLLYDVPGQTLDSWRATVGAALALEPDHLSAYALTLDDPDGEGLTGATGDHLPLRPGARRWRARAAAEQDDDRAADMYLLADKLLGAAGLGWYEISNWARPGCESRHNLGYWLGGAWEAVGPGAHAFDGARTRRWNAARLDAYLAAVAKGRLPPGGAETMDAATAVEQGAMLALRTSRGLGRAALEAPGLGEPLRWAMRNGLAQELDSSVILNHRGRLLANELFGRLMRGTSGAPN